jgi:hypothetical protein
LTVDKKLNPRQELFCQAVARGMSLNAACLAAGYKRTASVYLLVRKPNVRARIETLLAESAALSLISKPQLTQRLLGFVDKAEAGGSAAMLREGRQGLMDVAKLNGMVSALPPAPKPAPAKREPITEIRRVVVEPDGRDWEY